MSEVLTNIYFFLFGWFLVEAEYNAHFAAYETLLRESDVIVVCVPLNANTRHMINATQLNKMKKGVILINIARGPVVEEAALVEALESGRVSSSFSTLCFDFLEGGYKNNERSRVRVQLN